MPLWINFMVVIQLVVERQESTDYRIGRRIHPPVGDDERPLLAILHKPMVEGQEDEDLVIWGSRKNASFKPDLL